MQILSVSRVRDKLNELIDSVSTTREQITITKNGAPAAVLIGADEWDSLQETLFWLSRPGVLDDIARARTELDTGETYDEEHIRAEFAAPHRDRER